MLAKYYLKFKSLFYPKITADIVHCLINDTSDWKQEKHNIYTHNINKIKIDVNYDDLSLYICGYEYTNSLSKGERYIIAKSFKFLQKEMLKSYANSKRRELEKHQIFRRDKDPERFI